MPSIRLQSSDNEFFDIDVEIAKCSGTIKTLLENCGMEDAENFVIPLPNISSAIVRKVLHWINYHKDDDPLPTEDDENNENLTIDISPWDADFLKVDQKTVCHLILAAEYLDIKGLHHVGCIAVANMFKDKTPEELRQFFNIKNDFAAEPLRKLKKWYEEK